jgi:hypothetical protein
MGRCVAQLPRSCCRMSNAQKSMAACAWCMEPAFVVVVPVCCTSSVSGMATPRQSRLRSVCCCIPSRWVSAPLLWYDWSRRVHRRACQQLVRHQRLEMSLSPPATSPPIAEAILSRAQRACASLVARAAGSQYPSFHRWSPHNQALRRPGSPCHLARTGDSVTSS